MIELFTVEEINLMCIFDTSSRDNLINEFTAALIHFEDDITEIADSVIRKLKTISDSEYEIIEMYPV
jgi:hypothetical protein